MIDPACEVNEKVNREIIDRNQVMEEGTNWPLDINLNETIEAVEETSLIQKKIGRPREEGGPQDHRTRTRSTNFSL